jgi:hypothetical protein
MKDDILIGCVTAMILVISFFIFITFLSVNNHHYNMMTRCLESNGSWVLDEGQYICHINGVCTQ